MSLSRDTRRRIRLNKLRRSTWYRAQLRKIRELFALVSQPSVYVGMSNERPIVWPLNITRTYDVAIGTLERITP